MNNRETDCAFGGCVAGMLVMFVLFAIVTALTYSNSIVIESDGIMKPEITLTTDGKTIDTLYVYRIVKNE